MSILLLILGSDMHRFIVLYFSLFILLFTGCEKSQVIVSGVDEREANTIIVFLDSKGIAATKTEQAVSGVGGGAEIAKYNITVGSKDTISAMAILNQNGLPRRQGTTLLELFAKSGFMTTDKEETIRYQAGLEQQLQNMILMIDGVIDANVQLSFPTTETVTVPGAPKEKVTAAVYVKHQGIIDDPNSHLEVKIKRLIAGSVNGLDINDVTVVSDRSRFTDVTQADLMAMNSSLGGRYVKIWSIVMSQDSAAKFRGIFFVILLIATLFAALLGWMIWKMYPLLRKPGGLKELFHPKPFMHDKSSLNREETQIETEETTPPT